MNRIRVICAAGARPNFIKVAPLMAAMGRNAAFDPRLVLSGQHYDREMATIFLEELGIREPEDIKIEAIAEYCGATILYDPRSSRAVPDLVAAEGGRSALSRVGHAFFKKRMREEGAVFGGEVSGHYYFRDFWSADSGTIPALLMLELLSADGRKLSELMAEFRSRYYPSGDINSEVEDQAAKTAEAAERYSDGELTRLDGISVDYPDWHFNVRPSNTEPLLRLNLESLVSREDMERKRDEVLGLIRA